MNKDRYLLKDSSVSLLPAQDEKVIFGNQYGTVNFPGY